MRSRIDVAVVGVLGWTLVVSGAAPAAGVDLDGPWRLTVSPDFLVPFSCPAEVVQAGTSISIDAPTCTFALALAGTIDPGTGAFSASGSLATPLCPTVVATGSGTPGSDAFFGSFTCSGGPFPFAGTYAGSLCGNGAVDAGEDCDDGDVHDGDCCSSACAFAPAKSSCGGGAGSCTTGSCDGAGGCVLKPKKANTRCDRDALECTDDVCDGAGNCTHPLLPAGTPCLGDFSACTDGACDGGGSCVLTFNTAPCDDFNDCTAGDTCDGAGSCTPGAPLAAGTECEGDGDLCTLESCDPLGSCLASGGCSTCCGGPGCTPDLGSCRRPVEPGAKVLLRARDGTRNQLSFQWKRGETTTIFDFGDPLGGTDYEVCVYDNTPGVLDLAFRASAPAGGTCAGSDCWRANGFRGYRYKDGERTPDGIELIKLKAGSAGRASVQVKGRGSNLSIPFLGDGSGGGLAKPVTVQVRSSDAACFEATFATAQRSGPYEFRAKNGE